MIITDFGAATTSAARSVAIQRDGKIVAAGGKHESGSSDFALVRYNTDGTLDTSFDSDGIVITDFLGGNHDYVTSMAIQPDGSIAEAGYSGSPSTGLYDFALARYNSDGAWKPALTLTAWLSRMLGALMTTLYPVAVQPDGSLLRPAISRHGSNRDFALVRYHSDGAWIPTSMVTAC